MQKLEIIKPDTMKYCNKLIKIRTNFGEQVMSFEDAFEIMWTLLDATVGINKETEKLMRKIDNKFMLDKF